MLGTITLWSRIEGEEYFLSSCFQEEEENAVDYLEESWSDMAHWAGGYSHDLDRVRVTDDINPKTKTT